LHLRFYVVKSVVHHLRCNL